MQFDDDEFLSENTRTKRWTLQDWLMREISRTFGFVFWIILGGVAAGIFQAYLSLEGWSFSLAMMLLLCAAFSTAGVRSLQKHLNHMRLQRIFAARCHGCGYDLRVNPGRCPECGAATIARTGRGAMRV